MKAYHYTKLEDWNGIKNGSWKNKGVPGLAPLHRLGNTHPDAYKAGAVFCLSDPRPESWTDNEHFPNAWDNLTACVGTLLLEVDLDGLESDTKVVDWAFMEAFLTDTEEGPYASATRREAEKKYADSAVPLDDYVQGKVDCVLPEIVVEQSIGIDRIAFAADQSHLADSLRQYKPESQSLAYEKQMIVNIPGLAALV